MRPLPAALLTLILPALSAAAGEAEILAAGRAACAGFEGGTFSLAPDAVARTDLDGDGAADTVIDEQGFRCSTAAALYCGTGGCRVHFLVGDSVQSRLAKGWTVTDWAGDRIVLLQVHGTECGGTNLRRCYEALVWSEGAFRSLRDGR
jgi:hypothetical protein